MTTLIEFFKGLWITYLDFLRIYIANGRVILDYLHEFFDAFFYFFLYLTIALTTIYLILSLVAVFSKRKYKEKPFDMEKAPYITVQIPTRNEIIALRCAKKCLKFDYPKDKYEILIGDDSDKPEISKKLQEFADEHELVKVIKREKNIGFKPGNLNKMLEHTKGDYIAIFDSDFVPEEDFLKRMVAPFVHDSKVSVVQARWNFNNAGQNLVTVLASTTQYVFHHVVLAFMERFGTTSLCGSAEMVKKKELIDLGGWKSGCLTEDIEYALRLHKNGKKLIYLSDLECYSDVPYTPSDLYKQQMRWAHGVITSYKMHFKGIMLSKSIGIKRKLLSLCAGFGYSLPILIFALCAFGVLSFVTHAPSPINFLKFFSELGRNIALTSGLIIASFVALYQAKKLRYSFKMLLSSFSIGLVAIFYVNKGIFKSIFNKPMKWYLLNKEDDHTKF